MSATMFFKKIFLFYLLVVASFTSGCISSGIGFNGNDLEVHEKALGAFVLAANKGIGKVDSTCFDGVSIFLRRAPFSVKSDWTPRRLAGVWTHKFVTENSTFSGPDETITALKNGSTYNVLIDKKYAVHRYVLRNSTNGGVSVAYLSEDDLLGKVAYEQFWDHLDILSCQNYAYALSRDYANQLVSFTIVDKANSLEELHFITMSGGLGGFFIATV